MNNKNINQSIETDIEKTDVSIAIDDDKGKIIKVTLYVCSCKLHGFLVSYFLLWIWIK